MSNDEYQFRLERIREFCKEFRREDAEASNRGAPEEKINHIYNHNRIDNVK